MSANIRAKIIFNYNSYFSRLIPAITTFRTLYKTLPFFVNKKAEDILYIIVEGKVIGKDYYELDMPLNRFGLMNNECNIHVIFKIHTLNYSYNELLPSFNALSLNYFPTEHYNDQNQSQNQNQNQNHNEPYTSPVTISQFIQRLQPENITLTHEQITSVSTPYTGTGEENCSVCHDNMQSELLELHCGHKFHSQCIRNWLMNFSVLCPMCSSDARQTL